MITYVNFNDLSYLTNIKNHQKFFSTKPLKFKFLELAENINRD